MSAPFITRSRMARKLGAEHGERAEHRANENEPGFSERAIDHIRQAMLDSPAGASLRGEDIVNGAKLAGIRPPDDRAFGPVFAKAIRQGLIEPIGFAPRVKGHGTAGGRVYARGRSLA